jgi:ABC-type iron transport system FetAB ATPase subunit
MEEDEVLLRASNVSCVVGGRTLFAGQSLAVPKGGVLFVQGPSGVGKSTLLRVLCRLEPLAEGEVSLDGQSPESLGLPAWRARVSLIAQARVALQGTVREHFVYLLELASQRRRLATLQRATTADLFAELESTLEQAGLQSTEHDRFLDRRWETLSGGEYQRTHVCIGLALRTPVLLLDEPTSALDERSALLIEGLLEASEATLVWVSHDSAQAERIRRGARAGKVSSLTLAPFVAPAAPARISLGIV